MFYSRIEYTCLVCSQIVISTDIYEDSTFGIVNIYEMSITTMLKHEGEMRPGCKIIFDMFVEDQRKFLKKMLEFTIKNLTDNF